MPHHRLELLISACLFFLSQFVSANHANADDALAKKRLKVYLLVGQSNMQGHAQIQTLASLADDPKTAALLTTMRGADGQPKVCERV